MPKPEKTLGAIGDVAKLIQSFRDSAIQRNFSCEAYGTVGPFPLLALTQASAVSEKKIYLSAGNHGDEPAAPLALLELMQSGFFDDRVSWYITPLINPTGLAADTRENHEGIDLNRDYRETKSLEIAAHKQWIKRQPLFDLCLCLHEDWEATGYYLYELNLDQRPTLADSMIAAVGKHFPIDHATEIDGRPANAGILRPVANPEKRNLWPETIYLVSRGNRLSYTLEAASTFPLEQRIAAHVTAVKAAVALLLS